MENPDGVAAAVRAMQAACRAPVTIKCRLGVDDMDSYPEFKKFVETVAAAGVKHFLVHARKCWFVRLVAVLYSEFAFL